ncbi:MAG: hypothetical protein NTY04_00650 [Candidatus Staskawiczbacteria bacterium]|nr:hypothetical protein [Candidatus Staskawiczbacteria bacterium]
MKKKYIIFITAVFLICILCAFFFFVGSREKNFIIKRIAHAGGIINDTTYTDSIDALNSNLKKGFSYFELDFSFTSDNNLVCTHGWGDNFAKIFGYKPMEIPTLEEFLQLNKAKSKFNICTLDSLADWMRNNPSAYIITDIKENNEKNVLEALSLMAKKIPDFKFRIIPQIYLPDEFDKVKKMGYQQIIWTLYKYNSSDADVLSAVKNFTGPFAITMPQLRAKTNLPLELAKLKIPTYTHTVNSLDDKNEFIKKYSVSEIYTDSLLPNQ